MSVVPKAPLTRRRPALWPLALVALVLLPASVAAQQALPPSRVAPDETGTGGGPDTTITAPNTNSLGVTKPPGTSLGPGEVPSARDARRERALTDRIEGSVCDGCK